MDGKTRVAVCEKFHFRVEKKYILKSIKKIICTQIVLLVNSKNIGI